MNYKELENNIQKGVCERIAISNMECNIRARRKKNRNLFLSALSSCAVLIVCSVFLMKSDLNTKGNTDYINNISQNGSTNNTNHLTISEILKDIKSNNIISSNAFSQEATCFAYKPTIENLYLHADIVFVGNFVRNIKMQHHEGVSIYTTTEFHVSKMLKNKTNKEIGDNIVFERMGGAMTLDEYVENNISIRKDEFTNIPIFERKNYYVVQQYAPDNKLDFSSEDENNQYIVFLSLNEKQLMLSSGYYGMREINSSHQIYDYDTKTFINPSI